MAIPKSVTALAVIVALLGSGCTQPDPNAAPTYTCTPSNGGTPAPCYKAEHDQQVKEDALYAEAEAVYRKYIAEDERIYRAGGIDQPSDVLKETLSGDFLAQKMSSYEALKQSRTALVGGEFKVAWLKRAPKQATAGSLVTLQDCVDTSSAQLVTEGEGSTPAGYTSDVLHFTREQGQLKISSGLGDVVTKC